MSNYTGPRRQRRPPIRVLVLTSDPYHTLELADEVREIGISIRGGPIQLRVIPAFAVRHEDLQWMLLEHEPDIAHFSMHGIKGPAAGELSLSPENTRELTADLVFKGGMEQPQFLVDQKALVDLFRILPVQLAVLNACHTAPLAEALTSVVPCAIGMNGAISDRAARLFSRGFYRGLAYGRQVGQAFQLALNELNLCGMANEGRIPVLYGRAELQLSNCSGGGRPAA
jgi:hypothetical protein